MSSGDVFVLVIGTVAVILIAPFISWLSFAIAFVVTHFFLFCNVFRISRTSELIWAAMFLALSASSVLFQRLGGGVCTLLMLGATIVLVAIEMRKPSYHGLGWEKINPALRDWWESNVVQRGSS